MAKAPRISVSLEEDDYAALSEIAEGAGFGLSAVARYAILRFLEKPEIIPLQLRMDLGHQSTTVKKKHEQG